MSIEKKIKIFICIGIVMFTVWAVACIHGILFLTHPQISEREEIREKLSSFFIEGDIISAKYLYNDHGYNYLICLRPTTVNIYKNELSKSTSFWGIYDKKKNIVYFIISYWNPEIEKDAWKKVKIDSYKEYHIEMTNGYIGNILHYPETLTEYENENTIRL